MSDKQLDRTDETFTERLERLKELGAEPQTTVWDMSENDLAWLIEQLSKALEDAKEFRGESDD